MCCVCVSVCCVCVPFAMFWPIGLQGEQNGRRRAHGVLSRRRRGDVPTPELYDRSVARHGRPAVAGLVLHANGGVRRVAEARRGLPRGRAAGDGVGDGGGHRSARRRRFRAVPRSADPPRPQHGGRVRRGPGQRRRDSRPPCRLRSWIPRHRGPPPCERQRRTRRPAPGGLAQRALRASRRRHPEWRRTLTLQATAAAAQDGPVCRLRHGQHRVERQ